MSATNESLSPLAHSYGRGVGGEGPIATTLDKPHHVPIEQVQLGSRVATKNPKPWEYDASLPEPEQGSWSKIEFELHRHDGAVIDIQMLRPDDWLIAHEIETGRAVPMVLEELEFTGLALAKSVEACPPIAAGHGAVVTALIKTRVASELVRVVMSDGTELTGTAVHPVWSLDRNDWVSLGDLIEGESLATEFGSIEVLSTELFRTTEPVYNFETHGEHVYQVTQLGLLVHNAVACPKPAKRGPKTSNRAPHNAKIIQTRKLLEAGGFKVIAGGRKLKERLIRIVGGFKSARRADIIMENAAGVRIAIQVGKTMANGNPVVREARAISDLTKAGFRVIFVPYN